jgi:hypothetical protein
MVRRRRERSHERVNDESTSEQTIQAFAARLDAFAAQLSDRERQMLTRIVVRSLDPLERLSLRDVNGLLEPDEEALLQALEREAPEREPS